MPHITNLFRHVCIVILILVAFFTNSLKAHGMYIFSEEKCPGIQFAVHEMIKAFTKHNEHPELLPLSSWNPNQYKDDRL
jgi:hypothetical protein